MVKNRIGKWATSHRARLMAMAIAGTTAAAAHAGTIGYTAWDVSGSDKLVRFDLATGAGTVIGTGIGFNDVDGLSFDASGTLWGVQDGSGTGNRLIRIDLATGVGTDVGSLGAGPDDMGLAFGGGTMYMSANTSGTGKLYRINLGTGAATEIGNTTLSTGTNVLIRSLGYHAGTLYGWSNKDTLVTLNLANGSASTVGAFGFSSPTGGQDGFDIDPATGIGWSIAEVEHRTYSLNLATGAATIHASSLTCNGGSCSAGGFNSLAIAVPEPGTYALMAAGLLAVGGVARTRRRG